VMARVVLVLILFTTAVGLALTIGRDYLFTAGWSDELAPLVADVEAARGARFEQAVTLVEQPAGEYAATVTAVLLGPDPAARVAVWRALGVATGEIDPAGLGAELMAARPAVYVPDDHAIVRLAGVESDLRAVLAGALDE